MAIDSATSLLFQIGANTDDATANISRFRTLFGSSLSDLSTQFEGFVGELTGGGDKINASFTAMAAIAAGAAVGIAGALFEMADKTAETGEQLLLMSQQVGLSVEELSGLKVVSEQMGISFDTLARGVAIMDRSLSPFASSGATAAKALAAIGVSATTASGQLRPNADLMADIADKFAAMKDGANKTALAMSIFGRAGAEMIPILDKGGAAIRSASEEATKLGLAYTTAGAQQSAAFLESMRDIKFTAQGLGVEIGQSLMPALTSAMKGIASFVESSSGDIAAFANGFGSVLRGVGDVAVAVWDSLEVVGKTVALLAFEAIQAGEAIADATTLDFSDAKAALAAMKNGYLDATRDISLSFDNLQSKATSDAEAIGKAMSGDDITSGAATATDALSTLATSLQSVRQQVEALQDQESKPKAAADAQYQRGLIAAKKQLDAYKAQIAAGKTTAETLEQYEQEYYALVDALAQKHQLTLDQIDKQEADKAAELAQKLKTDAAAAAAAATTMWQKQGDAALAAINAQIAGEVKQATAAHDLQTSVDSAAKKLTDMAQQSADSTLSAGAKIRAEYQKQIQQINAIIAAQRAKGLSDQQAAQLATAAAAAETAAANQEVAAQAKLRQQQMQTSAEAVNSFLQMGLAATGYRSAMVDALMQVVKALEAELIAHITSASGAVAADAVKTASAGKSIGITAAWKGALHVAEALGDLAYGNFAGAAQHFAASASFLSVAASVGAAVAGIFSGGGGGGGGSSTSASNATGLTAASSELPTSTTAAAAQPTTVINLHLDGMVSPDNLATVMAQMTSLVQGGQAQMGASHIMSSGALVPTQ